MQRYTGIKYIWLLCFAKPDDFSTQRGFEIAGSDLILSVITSSRVASGGFAVPISGKRAVREIRAAFSL